MQALCDGDARGGTLHDSLNTLAGDCGAEAATVEYAHALCERYEEAGKDVDARIEAVLENWELKRIDSVTRNVIRMAAVELLMAQVPAKVVINEAIEIAREYATDESAKFVNAMVDALWKQTRKNAC